MSRGLPVPPFLLLGCAGVAARLLSLQCLRAVGAARRVGRAPSVLRAAVLLFALCVSRVCVRACRLACRFARLVLRVLLRRARRVSCPTASASSSRARRASRGPPVAPKNNALVIGPPSSK